MKVTLFDPEADLIIVPGRFACLGFQFSDFQIHAHDLPEGWGIHGLVGLTFLRQFTASYGCPRGETSSTGRNPKADACPRFGTNGGCAVKQDRRCDPLAPGGMRKQ